MQWKQACWNGGGLSLRRDVTNASIQEGFYVVMVVLIQEGSEGILTIRRNAKNHRHPKT
jgi:hypothetical protein